MRILASQLILLLSFLVTTHAAYANECERTIGGDSMDSSVFDDLAGHRILVQSKEWIYQPHLLLPKDPPDVWLSQPSIYKY